MIGFLYRLEQRIHEAFLRNAFPEYEDPQHRRLARAIRSLPYVTNNVFCMSRFQGLTYEQIAERLHITPERAQREMGRAMGMIIQSTKRQQRKGW